MAKRDPHSDNNLIDQFEDAGGAAQGSSAGGNLARSVGSRAELEEATGGDPEPVGVDKRDKRPEPPQTKTNRA